MSELRGGISNVDRGDWLPEDEPDIVIDEDRLVENSEPEEDGEDRRGYN